MRAAAFFAASLVLVGTWTVIAGAFALSAAWIAVGVLAVSVTTAVTYVASAPGTGAASTAPARATAFTSAD